MTFETGFRHRWASGWAASGDALRRLLRALLRTIIGAIPLILINATFLIIGAYHIVQQQLQLAWLTTIPVWVILFFVILKKMGPGIKRGAALFLLSLGLIIGAIAVFALASDLAQSMMTGFRIPPNEPPAEWLTTEFAFAAVATIGYFCDLGLQYLDPHSPDETAILSALEAVVG